TYATSFAFPRGEEFLAHGISSLQPSRSGLQPLPVSETRVAFSTRAAQPEPIEVRTNSAAPTIRPVLTPKLTMGLSTDPAHNAARRGAELVQLGSAWSRDGRCALSLAPVYFGPVNRKAKAAQPTIAAVAAGIIDAALPERRDRVSIPS